MEAALGWDSGTSNGLDTLTAQLQTLQETTTTIAALHSLGEALRVTGNLEPAKQVLQQSLEIAQRQQQPTAIATAQFKLANLILTEALLNLNRSNLTVAEAVELVQLSQQGDRRIGIEQSEQFDAATAHVLQLYRQAATDSTMQLLAQLNQLRILVETEQYQEFETSLPAVQQLVSSLPPGQKAIEARINLAQSLVKLSRKKAGTEIGLSSQLFQEIAQLLTITAQQAKELQNSRSESFALGYLGELYEQTGQLQAAQQLTRQAQRALLASSDYQHPYFWAPYVLIGNWQ